MDAPAVVLTKTWRLAASEVTSRAMLIIILRRSGLSIRENAACNSRVSRVLAKQMCDLLRRGIFSNRCRR